MRATTTVILGGGFGGIAAANSLRQLLTAEHEIVVIDESPRFHVGAGKTWIMLGEKTYEQISRTTTALLEPGVRFVQAKVERIALADRAVVAGAEPLKWDFLVIALGAYLNMDAVPGLAEAAGRPSRQARYWRWWSAAARGRSGYSTAGPEKSCSHR